MALIIADAVVAREMMRSLMRDIRVQLNNGLPVPPWAQAVLSELAAAAEVESPAIGTALATVVVAGGNWVPVTEAAEATGVSGEYVRRLARSGRIRGHRAGARTWLVDMESLKGVLANANQERKAG